MLEIMPISPEDATPMQWLTATLLLVWMVGSIVLCVMIFDRVRNP